ncbi:MAG: SPFH domain-containing protein [Bifidobacteriaceae bacterium]|nr:SPFH domain-containing protein [Bifidobacteriaceae bacterium]
MANDVASSSARVRTVDTPKIAETKGRTMPGWVGLLGALAIAAGGLVLIVWGQDTRIIATVGGVVLLTAATVIMTGWTVVVPGTTKVLVYFGRYIGTVRQPGFYQTAPLAARARMSVRVRNFETSELKVNDADGNPVNIAAIVVWRVADTAKARFAVEDYTEFVTVQAESALRHVATTHPYDGPDSAVTLRGATAQVSDELASEVAERVAVAGVEIDEVRISKLAYAPEIAQSMLQRQQAGAIIAARERIVEGAVTMVHEALNRLEREGIVNLDDERRAAMVSNLLVVLTGEARATPVINTGTLYA